MTNINKKRFKKIIVLVLDALNINYLKAGSKEGEMLPNILRLANNGIWYKNVFVGGAPTQMALPVIFTSSYPLDYNGYGRGIKDHPKNITEIFKENGYATFGITTAPGGSRYYGYSKGFDEYLELFDLRGYVYQFRKYQYGFRKILIESGRVKKSKAIENLQGVTSDFFISLEETINSYETYWNTYGYDVFNPYGFNFLKKIVLDERDRFLKSKVNYVESLLDGDRSILFDHFASSKELRPSPVDSRQAIDILLKKILNNDEKIFAYLHLLDIHDSKTFNYYRATSDSDLKKILLNAWDKIDLSLEDNPDNDKINDFITTVYIDYHIGKLIGALEDNNILDDTLLVIMNDHGKVDRSRPVTTHLGFWDELSNTNVMFYNTKLNSREEDSLFSAIDFAPTLLDMVGIEKECTFKGNIMEHKDYVLYESLGKGDCDFSAKPILVCARSERMKVIYEESDWYWLLGSYNKIKVFDLIDDPGEKKPLTKKTYSKSDEYKMLVNAARSRSKEIRSMHKYEISLSNILKMNIRNNIKRFFRVLRRLV